MNHFLHSPAHRLGAGPLGRGTSQHYIPDQADSPSILEGALPDSSRHNHPCSGLEKWTGSDSSSPSAMVACQPPWSIETTQGYIVSPSYSPTKTLHDDMPRMVPPYEGDWSSPTNTSVSGSLKSGLRRLHGCRDPPGWGGEPEGGNPCDIQHNPSFSSPPAPGSHHQFPMVAEAAYSTNLLPTPSSIDSQQSFLHGQRSPPSLTTQGDHDGGRSSPDDTKEDANADPPYSLLIYQALCQAPGMKLPLQGIYTWFEKHTEKGKDRNSKGWQNSIRHNLSMNAGFEAVREESMPGKKAVSFWRLTDEAVKNGIQSTTRYRKQANYRKTLASEPPAPQRQRSGAKGGKATKFTAKFRGHLSQEEFRKERCRQRMVYQRRPHKNLYGQYQPHPSSPYHVPGSAAPLTRASVESFELANVVGCADPPCAPIFCDMAGSGPDCLAFDAGFLGWGGAVPPFTQALLLTGPEIATDCHIPTGFRGDE